MKLLKRFIYLALIAFTIFSFSPADKAEAAHRNLSKSDKISHYNISTGFTVTDYIFSADVNYIYTGRTEITFSGFNANYYTPRFMDPNISYNGTSSFRYTPVGSSAQFGGIGAYSWPTSNQYYYYNNGSPWRTTNKGNYTQFVTSSGQRAKLDATFLMRCSKDTATLTCGSGTVSGNIN